MKALALLALLLFVVGSTAAACGGGDGEQAALEQYFQSAKELDVAYEEQYDVFQQQLDDELAAAAVEEESLESLRSNFGANLAIFTDFVDGMDDLSAPNSVKGAHNASIDALRIYLERLQEAKSRLAEAGSVSEIEAIYTDEDLALANKQAVTTCIALQNIATKIGIEIDIGCLD